MPSLFLGIDTSNYKTSVSVVDTEGQIIINKSEYLEVKLGERGLRQSEAFFKQSNNLPVFIRDVFNTVNPADISAVGVSTRPRRVEGSYMPCFLAGSNLAQELSSALKIPVYEFSHQEGHVAAVIDTSNCINDKSLIFHLSGGTTEALLCEKDDLGYKTEIVGGTKDISIGQLLDRVGVQIGYSFPAGIFLDEIAYQSIKNIKTDKQLCHLPIPKIHDGYFNLSGIETKLAKIISSNNDDKYDNLIVELFTLISIVIRETIESLINKYNISNVYLVGGVSSSSTIRYLLKDTKYIFGKTELSGDNAVGIALLTKDLFKKGR